MTNITQYIKDELLSHGADLVGIGDLSELPPDIRCDLPIGISIAVRYSKDVIRGISELPTKEYYNEHDKLNEKLDMLAALGADALKSFGHKAVPQTREYVNYFRSKFGSLLPHKTVATRAGVGWIGKSALLVTEEFGSMVRLSSILTDAPLVAAEPVNKSRCGNCKACTEACPAGANTGKLWEVGISHDGFYNAAACRQTMLERSKKGFGIETTICGKCIEACPYTRRYINRG